MDKRWDIQTVGFYLVQKGNELSSPEKTRALKSLLLSERSHSEKSTCCRVPTVGHPGEGKTMGTVATRGLGREWGIGGAQRIFRAVEILYMMSL